jgi:hypothetical protein
MKNMPKRYYVIHVTARNVDDAAPHEEAIERGRHVRVDISVVEPRGWREPERREFERILDRAIDRLIPVAGKSSLN